MPDTVFYSLPAEQALPGMSTADGQHVTDVDRFDDRVQLYVYTPRPDDPDQDISNRSDPETRVFARDERVDLAVFSTTAVDASEWDDAEVRTD